MLKIKGWSDRHVYGGNSTFFIVIKTRVEHNQDQRVNKNKTQGKQNRLEEAKSEKIKACFLERKGEHFYKN